MCRKTILYSLFDTVTLEEAINRSVIGERLPKNHMRQVVQDRTQNEVFLYVGGNSFAKAAISKQIVVTGLWKHVPFPSGEKT